MGASTRNNDPLVYLLGHSVLDRRAYRLLLSHDLELEVAVETDFDPTSVWAALRTKPDLIIVDVDNASAKVVDAVQMIARLRPDAQILVIGNETEPTTVQVWGSCSIAGYVVKDAGQRELRMAVKAVLAGEQHFSNGIRSAIRTGRRQAARKPRLSPRESELLPLLARGLTLREAASQMTVSYKTADTYRTSLMRKVGVRDRVELARYAIREKIIDP